MRYRQRVLGGLERKRFKFNQKGPVFSWFQFIAPEEYDQEVADARTLIADAVVIIASLLERDNKRQAGDPDNPWIWTARMWLRYANEMLYATDTDVVLPDDDYDETLRKLSATVRKAWVVRKRRKRK